MIAERIQEILSRNDFSIEDFQELRKSLGLYEKYDTPMEAVVKTDSDSLGTIQTLDCPRCGITLEFRRNAELERTHKHCTFCGQKIKNANSELGLPSDSES